MSQKLEIPDKTSQMICFTKDNNTLKCSRDELTEKTQTHFQLPQPSDK